MYVERDIRPSRHVESEPRIRGKRGNGPIRVGPRADARAYTRHVDSQELNACYPYAYAPNTHTWGGRLHEAAPLFTLLGAYASVLTGG